MSASVCSREKLLEDGSQAQLAGGAGVLADIDGQLAHALDDVEDLLTGLLGDDLAQQRTQQSDLA